jgi:hypothetical protein
MKWPYVFTATDFMKDFYNQLKGLFSNVGDDMQEQKSRVDTLIQNVPQPSEVVDIRTAQDSTVYPTARDRIAADRNALQENIDQNKTDQGTINAGFTSQLANNMKVVRQLITARSIMDGLKSTSASIARYEDTLSTIFSEHWDNLSNWVTNNPTNLTVNSSQLFCTAVTTGQQSGANHAISLGTLDKMRAIFNIHFTNPGGSAALIFGVSDDAPGAEPTPGAENVFGIHMRLDSKIAFRIDHQDQYGTSNTPVTDGDYTAIVDVDDQNISVCLLKNDGSIEFCVKKPRTEMSVNNLYVFNTDGRGVVSIGTIAMRRGLETIYPRNLGEGQVKTVQWTGDGTQSWRIYLPVNYDSRIPSSLAICWHGNGSDETYWSAGSDSNYPQIQKALVAAGYIVMSCCLNSSKYTWGNSASTNSYYQAYRYVRDNYAISGTVFFANSMGGIESLNALSENKIPCVAWAATSPTFNLNNNYNNPAFMSLIKTAYGIASDGSDYAAKTVGRDPALMDASAFRGLPMWFAAAMDDTAVSKTANADALATVAATASMSLTEISVPSGGHTFNVSPYLSQIIAFFNQYTAS